MEWKINQSCSLILKTWAMFCSTLHQQPPAPSLPHRHKALPSLPVLWSCCLHTVLISLRWTCAGQREVETLLQPKEQCSKPVVQGQPALLLRASRDPGALTSTLIIFPLCCSQRTSRCSLGCYNLALPGISPVHPCVDSRVFKAETAEEYIQESVIKSYNFMHHGASIKKRTELVPQNNYMCRVHCKHSFYVHQHSWGQCLKI